MLRGLVEGLLSGHQKKADKYRYKELEVTPFLFSSDHLNSLYDESNKGEKEDIYDHMLRHKVIDEEFPGYFNLATKIENDLWRD